MKRANTLRVEKWAIWATLIAVLYLLRHLFPIFFLTFVLSYIGNTVVNALTVRLPRRRVNVVIVYVAFLALIVGSVLVIVPRILSEARNIARQYIATEAARDSGESETFLQRESRKMVDGVIVGIAGSAALDDFRQSDAYAAIIARIDGALAPASKRVVAEVTAFANDALLFVMHFVLALILSFVLMWDLPRTRERLERLATGRTAEIYREIAPGIIAFGTMLGRAFEAQSLVAVVNAVLSLGVFLLLDLPSTALLATIVFVCSYIPLAGMILSTIPAAFLALRVGGISHVLWLVVAILVIHAVEAYMLNPIIYGRHLRLHPLAVLFVLVIAEHLFGVWGLLLGVPIAAFCFKYLIEGTPVAEAPAPQPATTV